MSYLFDPGNWEWLITGNNARFILEGFLINLEIAVIAMVFALVVGLALALLRLSRDPVVSFVAGIWVDVFRNLPLIFLILYMALALPISWRDAWEENVPGWAPEAYRSGFVFAALVALVLYNSAVITEVMRRGRIVTSSNFFAAVEAPVLHVFVFIGLLFVLVNYALSRLSRRLEVGQRRRVGTEMKEVKGVEDQLLSAEPA